MVDIEGERGSFDQRSRSFTSKEFFDAGAWMLSKPLREAVPGYFESDTDKGVIFAMSPDLLFSIIEAQRAQRKEQYPQELPDSIFVQGKMEVNYVGEIEIAQERVKVAKFIENPPNSYT